MRNGTKRILLTYIGILSLASILLLGCDLYAGKRPRNYKNTRWVSEEPNIYFEVDDSHDISYAQIIINDTPQELFCGFDYGATIAFFDNSYHYLSDGRINSECELFRGDCKFGKDKLVVKISDNKKGFLDESIKEITFIREELEDSYPQGIWICGELNITIDFNGEGDRGAYTGKGTITADGEEIEIVCGTTADGSVNFLYIEEVNKHWSEKQYIYRGHFRYQDENNMIYDPAENDIYFSAVNPKRQTVYQS